MNEQTSIELQRLMNAVTACGSIDTKRATISGHEVICATKWIKARGFKKTAFYFRLDGKPSSFSKVCSALAAQ